MLFILLVAPLFLHSREAFAARILKVQGQQVLIDNEDTELAFGDRFYVLIEKKKKGLVRITKVQGRKSLGRITKGKAEVDALLEPALQKSAEEEAESEPTEKKRRKRSRSALSGLVVGGLAGYAMDSQSVTVGGKTHSMSGSGLSAKIYGDLPIMGTLSFMGRGGFEQFNVAGGTVAATGEAGKTTITYATLDGLVKYAFAEGSVAPFVGAGIGFHMPISSSSNMLTNISATSVFFGNVGADIKSGELSYHILGEYGLLPPSSTVSTNLIAVRLGAGWSW